jgi:hypothetical protein
MKKIVVLLSACLLISLISFSQEILPEQVPSAVKDAFAKKFPDATFIKYKMDKKDFEVSFKNKGVGMAANFNSSGEWLETETVMIESDLPKEVKTSIATNFVGFIITEVAKIDGPNNVENYEVTLKKDKDIKEVKFSPKGEVLKKTPLKK